MLNLLQRIPEHNMAGELWPWPGDTHYGDSPGLRAQRGQSETIHHGVLDKVTLADTGSMNMTITNSLRTIVPTVSEEIHKYDVYQQKNLPLDTEPG